MSIIPMNIDIATVNRQAASEFLEDLCDVGVLKEAKVGRQKLFIHHKLVTLLTPEKHNVPAYRP